MYAWKMKALFIVALCLSFVGCGGKEEQSSAVNEPVTLTFYSGQNFFLDFEKDVAEPIRNKYPHITLELVKSGKGTTYQELIAQGKPFDIIYDSAAFTANNILDNGLGFELRDMAKKHNLDLNRFEPNVLSQSVNSNADKKLYGIPFLVNKYVLIYNKDIFDRFGVPYPKDGMTWDDVYELAKRVSRTENGVYYQGFNAVPNNMMLNNQLSIIPLHHTENKAAVYTADWARLVNNLKRFFEITSEDKVLPINDFSKGRIAMTVHNTNPIATWVESNPGLNWDIASTPTLPDRRDVGFKPATLALFVGQTSAHKDAAFLVIKELVSEEVQLHISKQGFGTPLASQTVKRAFGQDNPLYQGKNTKAVYYLKDAPASEPRADKLIDVDVNFNKVLDKVLVQGMDVNSALRQFEEEINQMIQSK
jgi:multiple sugar transport system substrate-binding protein